jgi:hypothetical protein
MLKKILITMLLLVAFQTVAFAQSGIRYDDFAKRLELYFHPDLISDIAKEMGRTDFTVWSWDVGDFSGDGHPDVAFAVRRAGGKGRTMEVYMFADIDGFLVKVGQFNYEFIELPLEVGVAFRYGILYVTQKFRQFNWKIESFKFVNGSLVNYDKYFTSRKGRLTNETRKNYYNLRNTEKYLITSSGRTEFWADYLTIPSYSRGRQIYKGITSEAFSNCIEYVPEGAYWWDGDEDLSYYVSSAYDNEYLYFTIFVIDDIVVRPYKSIENGEAIEVWIDATDYDSDNDRFAKSNEDDVNFNNENQNIYKIHIYLGDFVNKEPVMSLSSADGSNSRAMNSNIVADLTDNGYYAMFKIPFSALGRSDFIVNDKIIEWGCTVRVIDVDNEFRPERRTVLQTSLFKEGIPSSFGSIAFVPDGEWYGETYNIYQDKIMQALEAFGF